MFALLRSAVCGDLLPDEEISLYSPDILPEITSIAKKHDVIHLLVLALKKTDCLTKTATTLRAKCRLRFIVAKSDNSRCHYVRCT